MPAFQGLELKECMFYSTFKNAYDQDHNYTYTEKIWDT